MELSEAFHYDPKSLVQTFVRAVGHRIVSVHVNYARAGIVAGPDVDRIPVAFAPKGRKPYRVDMGGRNTEHSHPPVFLPRIKSDYMTNGEGDQAVLVSEREVLDSYIQNSIHGGAPNV